MNSSDLCRYDIRLYGIVQGVGYRPYIYQKAEEYHIYGWVNNAGASVAIDAEGKRNDLGKFISDIVGKPPTLALLEKVKIMKMENCGYKQFEIRQSKEEQCKVRLVAPDVGVCSKCMEEVWDVDSSRYRYAFTNCTECGPRYSIMKLLPYDRCNTTMKDFQLCEKCGSEYESPVSRRFHTQPNCCRVCGPKLKLIDRNGHQIACSDPLEKTIQLVKDGMIAAIKGIGGFHLCCDAMNPMAVDELRRRKQRPHKPLAVMAASADSVRSQCILSQREQLLLESPARPIVLLGKGDNFNLPSDIAPGLQRLGMMLPYTPLHYLLFDSSIEYLVMTSGNTSGSPIQYENKDAINELKGVADFFLLHDRDIHNPVDDSVVRVVAERNMVSRSARGYTPYVLKLRAADSIFSAGAEQKNTFCLSQSGYVYMSQYLGDLKDLEAYESYISTIGKMTSLLQIKPQVYAYDLHPQYLSTRYVLKQDGVKIPVQHHHAHMASCMVEHNLFDDAIGVVFDGTGLGDDGSIWGGEFLLGSRKSFRRIAHLKQVLLQGGDAAAKEPWRSAASYLHFIGCNPKDHIKAVDDRGLGIVLQALESGFNCHKSSSMGRLFDCAAAIIGVRPCITYDAQAAIELESILDPFITNETYSYCIEEHGEVFELDFKDMIYGLVRDKESNVAASVMSARFHNTLIAASVEMLAILRSKYSINKVVLSGGVFENSYLLENLYYKLKASGFSVFFNERVPINDSGISIGQLAIAYEAIRGD